MSNSTYVLSASAPNGTKVRVVADAAEMDRSGAVILASALRDLPPEVACLVVADGDKFEGYDSHGQLVPDALTVRRPNLTRLDGVVAGSDVWYCVDIPPRNASDHGIRGAWLPAIVVSTPSTVLTRDGALFPAETPALTAGDCAALPDAHLQIASSGAVWARSRSGWEPAGQVGPPTQLGKLSKEGGAVFVEELPGQWQRHELA